MSGDEVRDAIAALGLDQIAVAHLLGVTRRAVVGWVADEPPAPPLAVLVLRLLTARPELVTVLREVMDRPELERLPRGRPRKPAD